MLVSLFVKGMIIGFLIAAPVGPINVLCVRRTMMHGRIVGLVSGLGAAVADSIYAAVAAFGLGFIQSFLVRERVWLSLAGTVLLVIIGARILISGPPQPTAEPDPPNLIGDFTSTLFLTLANPVTVLSFLAVFTAFGVEGDSQIDLSDWLLLAGVFCGAAAWWTLVTEVVAFFHGRIPYMILNWANRLAGVTILAFAVAILSTVIVPRI